MPSYTWIKHPFQTSYENNTGLHCFEQVTIFLTGVMFLSSARKFPNMAEILCPNCDAEIELDDDASGLFECPFCDQEFEWEGESVETDDQSYNATPIDGIKAMSHGMHGLGGLMAIIGLFSGWIVIGDFAKITPFGATIEFFGISASMGWFSMFGEGEALLAIFGIIFMILVLIAVCSQIIHIVYRITVHMIDSGNLEVSAKMEFRAYKYRWHTSLIALCSSIAAYLLAQIGSLISIGTDGGFPRPSVFVILLLITMGTQFYFMNKELLSE